MAYQNTPAPSEWDKKYMREQPFMAFGSLMNSYGLINKGVEITADELAAEAEILFNKAQEFTQRSFNETQEEECDLPTLSVNMSTRTNPNTNAGRVNIGPVKYPLS